MFVPLRDRYGTTQLLISPHELVQEVTQVLQGQLGQPALLAPEAMQMLQEQPGLQVLQVGGMQETFEAYILFTTR